MSGRRGDPLAVAVEVLARKIGELKDKAVVSATVSAEAQVILDADRLHRAGMPWADAYGNARALASMRRFDAERRVRHAADHLWCVPDECPVAAGREVNE